MTNPLLNIVSEKFYEVTKHLTLTNHMYTRLCCTKTPEAGNLGP